MNVFVIGVSGSGKSTISRMICERFGFNHVKPSKLLREQYPHLPDESVVDHVNRMTVITCDLLKSDSDYFFRQIVDASDSKGRNVYDGMRNPRDFMRIFNPSTDIVIHAFNKRVEASTKLEQWGTGLILSVCSWMQEYMGAAPTIVFEWTAEDKEPGKRFLDSISDRLI